MNMYYMRDDVLREGDVLHRVIVIAIVRFASGANFDSILYGAKLAYSKLCTRKSIVAQDIKI